MKQQTPLRKAIAEIEAIPQLSDGYVNIKKQSLITILTNLLPEERRVIEEAYNNGSNDMGSSEFGGCPKHLNGKDFFTSNFEQ